MVNTNYGNLALSSEQLQFINKVKEGKNVLVDACIGSGKTTAIQRLCDNLSSNTKILYLTYNKLLKIDAKSKIKNKNVMVTNYHGFAYNALKRVGIQAGVSELIQAFNNKKPHIDTYDLLIIDEYQDIELELSEMLNIIKQVNPRIQIVAVGDMAQKIYDKTTLQVPEFMNRLLGDHIVLEFTQCFRLSSELASSLGRVWNKSIIGVNKNCTVEKMNVTEVVNFLSKQQPKDILCLGARTGDLADTLNLLEKNHSDKFNKSTVFASISDKDSVGATQPKPTSAIFTTFDSSKGLERKICIVFDYTLSYWQVRVSKPLQSYEILRNIFCVAASRGKERIIFVENEEAMLDEKALSSKSAINTAFKAVPISGMFDFKYKEDIELCYSLINVTFIPTESNNDIINIRNSDGLIDLSPCIGTYQEAVYFKDYNIDDSFELYYKLNPDLKRQKNNKDTNLSLDEKILLLTYLETKQNRYRSQVVTPFVSEIEKDLLITRLNELFNPNETVQPSCEINFYDSQKNAISFSAIGFADVVKNNIVYELKFVSELTHDHFLQCACYMIALKLDKGILWNTRNNTKYEITITDKKKFLDAITKTITKGTIVTYHVPDKEAQIV